MMKTTQERRDEIRAGLAASHGGIPCSRGTIENLLDDADRCAALEAVPVIRFGVCAHCGWRSEDVDTDEESTTLATDHAVSCEHNPLVKRIAALEAKLDGACNTLEKYQAANRHNEARAIELESALRKVDEIRGDFEKAHGVGNGSAIQRIIDALKVHCMAVCK